MKKILAVILFAVCLYGPSRAFAGRSFEGTEWWLLSGVISQGFYQGQVYICCNSECASFPDMTYGDTKFTTDDASYSGAILFGSLGVIRLATEDNGVFYMPIHKRNNDFIPPAIVD